MKIKFLIVLIYLFNTVNGYPQSIMDRMALAGMTVAHSLANAISNGGAIRREANFETPYIKVFSKAEVGIGEAIKPKEINDRANDDYIRRKRSVLTPSNYLAACYSMIGGGVPTLDGVDTVATRKRRMQKTAKSSKKKKLVSNLKYSQNSLIEDELSRRKRQLNDATDIAEQWKTLLRDTWNSFLNKINEKTQNMQQIMTKNVK